MPGFVFECSAIKNLPQTTAISPSDLRVHLFLFDCCLSIFLRIKYEQQEISNPRCEPIAGAPSLNSVKVNPHAFYPHLTWGKAKLYGKILIGLNQLLEVMVADNQAGVSWIFGWFTERRY